MKFTLDSALLNNAIELGDWPLCKVLFKNESQFAWFLLIPQRIEAREIYQLNEADQMVLMKEIARLSEIIEQYFHPDKLNVAAIGNKTPQLHIHIVGRFKNDPLWPESIWQKHEFSKPYSQKELMILTQKFKQLIQ